MNKLTKAQLITLINMKDEELLALRAELSALRKQAKATDVARKVKEHEYNSYAEASENCKRLAAEPALEQWTFSVQGTKVIGRQRLRLAA